MKKIAFVLAVILVFSIPLSVQAAQPRAISIVPEITLEGTSLTCYVSAAADHISEHLEATIRIYRENTLIYTWYASGYGYIDFTRTRGAPSGYTYRMTVDLTVDGVAIPQATAST